MSTANVELVMDHVRTGREVGDHGHAVGLVCPGVCVICSRLTTL